jgi:hypothetical protein
VCIIAAAIFVYLRKLEFWVDPSVHLAALPSLALVLAIEGSVKDIIEMGSWGLMPG